MALMRKGKKSVVVIICAALVLCLAGAAAAGIRALQKNPLAEGLEALGRELLAEEEVLGENFWTDSLNQAGSGKIQADYSLNLSGNPLLKNITVGVDGHAKRDMDMERLAAEMQLSVANIELGEIAGYGDADTCYLQIPSLWDGSVVFEPGQVSRQWNESALKKQLETALGQDFTLKRDIDIQAFERFSLIPCSVKQFSEEHEEALKALYQKMEVLKLEKAMKTGGLDAGQAKELKDAVLKNADGEEIGAIPYLTVLPQEELSGVFSGVTTQVRLCVYLDRENRIVRVCTIPGEVLLTKEGEATFSLNLLGEENTIDYLEIQGSFTAAKDSDAERDILGAQRLEAYAGIEKRPEKAGRYYIEGNGIWEGAKGSAALSFEGEIQGEQAKNGGKLSLDLDELEYKVQEETLIRLSGEAVLEPLTEEIALPAGAEYRIGEMDELETMLFLAECSKNLFANYGGYLNLLGG